MLEKQVELLSLIEFWLENEDSFYEWMESVIDEKLENLEKYEPSNIQSIPNDLFEIDEEQREKVLIEQLNLEKALTHLKTYTKLIKQKLLSQNIEEQFANLSLKNSELLKKFQNDLELDFKKIISSENLCEYFDRTHSMLFNLNSFERRLILNRTKETNKTKSNQSYQAYPSETIQKHIVLLENKLSFLNCLYNENIKSTQLLIESLINELTDCYPIFF
jgi:hypothetical protein